MAFSAITILLLFCASSATGEVFQWNPSRPRSEARSPVYDPYAASVQRPSQQEVQQPQGPARFQEKQNFQKPLAWRFPEIPAEETRFPPQFKLEKPVPVQSVTVLCGVNTIRVEVRKDILGIGQRVLPEEVLLGDCPTTSEDPVSQVLVFESELHACGSQLMMTEDSFVYVFTLHYTPSPLGNSPIIRSRDVAVTIECHYQRKQDVSSEGVRPTWTPFDALQASEESLRFSLKMMSDDWQFERPSQQFLLGDMMRFEASVQQLDHIPLRVFVDSCVATLIPNTDTVPRYSFVDNHGCMMDSKLTGSSSQFLHRTQDNKLRFQIEAFKFQDDNYGMLYITCELRATAATAPTLPTNKACYFSQGWREVSGQHNTCFCCDTDCGATWSSNYPNAKGAEGRHEMAVGPIHVNERPLN